MAYNKQKRNSFLERLRIRAGMITYACKDVNIDYVTYQNWRKKYPDFDKDCDHILNVETADRVESALMKRILAGDTTAIIFYCKTKLKSRGYTERTELTGADGEPLVKARVLTKEEARKFLEDLEKEV